jgi:hypothetical protein
MPPHIHGSNSSQRSCPSTQPHVINPTCSTSHPFQRHQFEGVALNLCLLRGRFQVAVDNSTSRTKSRFRGWLQSRNTRPSSTRRGGRVASRHPHQNPFRIHSKEAHCTDTTVRPSDSRGIHVTSGAVRGWANRFDSSRPVGIINYPPALARDAA